MGDEFNEACTLVQKFRENAKAQEEGMNIYQINYWQTNSACWKICDEKLWPVIYPAIKKAARAGETTYNYRLTYEFIDGSELDTESSRIRGPYGGRSDERSNPYQSLKQCLIWYCISKKFYAREPNVIGHSHGQNVRIFWSDSL